MPNNILSRVFWDKTENIDENIATMDIVSTIESFGGFVFSSETKSMPKEYLTMHDTYIISPDIKSNKTIPAFLKKTLKLSELVANRKGYINLRDGSKQIVFSH